MGIKRHTGGNRMMEASLHPRDKKYGRRHLRRREERLGGYRLFGGDAAKQRAEIYAAERGWALLRMDQVNPEKFGLDLWGRDHRAGVKYDYVVIRELGPRWFRALAPKHDEDPE